MVTVIHHSKSLKNVLNYNEQKTKQGKAKCLKASNYPKTVTQLNFYQKLNRLTRQAALNERTRVNAVHISLNFDIGENIPEPVMVKIATEYMERIGFGEQPYLVYRHYDAGHDHLHLVTTNIKTDGKRISLHNLGRIQSEKARREMEIKYSLVRAESKGVKQALNTKPINAVSIQYGKSEIRRSIANVLGAVISKYRYTSFPELNAVLQLYNLMADRGTENSRIFKRGGVVYRVLDEQGLKAGVPIKASLLPGKPGLKLLEEKFIEHEHVRVPFKRRIKTVIDWALAKSNERMSINQLTDELAKEGIDIIKRLNKDGLLYGITYIDHKNKVVFNGSDLGKAYSAKGLLERCGEVTPNKSSKIQLTSVNKTFDNIVPPNQKEQKLPKGKPGPKHQMTLLGLLTDTNQHNDFMPGGSHKKRHKKRRKS